MIKQYLYPDYLPRHHGLLTSNILNGELGPGMAFPKHWHIEFYGKQLESNSKAKGLSLNSALLLLLETKLWDDSLKGT